MIKDIISCVSTIFFFFSNKMNNGISRGGLFLFTSYVKIYSLLQNVIFRLNTFFKKQREKTLICISNNCIKNEIILDNCIGFNFNILPCFNDYDLVFYKDCNNNFVRLRYNNINTFKTFNISNIKFLDIKLSYEGTVYKIEFGEDNYYINGNVLFDRVFISWFIKHKYNIDLDDSKDYRCTIMDNDVNMITINKYNSIVIDADTYSVLKIKDL